MQINFDFNSVSVNATESTNAFEPLPEGTYELFVQDMKESQKNAGTICMCFEVVDGQYRGRKFWEFFSLAHQNEKVREIAQRSLVFLTRACGLESINDTEELGGSTFMAEVKIDRWNPEKPQNKIKRYIMPSVLNKKQTENMTNNIANASQGYPF